MLKNHVLLLLISLLFASCSESFIKMKGEKNKKNNAPLMPNLPVAILGCTNPAATNFNISATQDNGSCTFPPGSITQSCTVSNGTGNEVSNDGGVTWGTCNVTSCDSTFTQVSNACVPANQNRSCAVPNGAGSQSSNNGGVTWSLCGVVSCNATFNQVGGNCVQTNQNQNCAISNGLGTQASTDGGVTWGSCTVSSCNATYTQVGNTCVQSNQSQACSITNGTGTQSSTDGGQTWGTCAVDTCNATYSQVGNTCVLTNQSQACAITNGTGTQSSTDAGATWGACTVASCNATYTQVSNACQLTNQNRACTTQPTNSTSGQESSTDGGVTWGTCTSFTCDTNYSLVSGACQINPPTSFLKISAGSNFSCGITSAGAAYCWGANYSGQIGDNSTTQRTSPVAVNTAGVLSGKTVKSISTGDSNPCVIASDNLAYCWGYGQEGALGNGISSDSSVPVAVSRAGVLSGKTIKQLSTGYGYTCVVASDDLAYCWGYNNEGQIGNLNKVDSNVPVAVSTAGLLNGKKILSVMAGHDHSCALADDNRIYCWGKNDVGQLGNGNFTSSLSPVAVSNTGVLSGKTIKSISSYMSKSTCALTTDHLVYCWGNNDSSQLGNGLYANSNVPVAVNMSGALSGKTVESISVGRRSACVRDSLSDLYCWGNNASGTLGAGDTSIHASPILVLGNISFDEFSVGNGHVCGIGENTVFCWGTNAAGELGNGSTTPEYQPEEITGGLAF